MIVVLKESRNDEQVSNLVDWIKSLGLDIHFIQGTHRTVMGLLGDTSLVDIDLVKALEFVEDVMRVQEPYKNANRKFHPEDSVIKVGNTTVGGGSLALIAGPCSVESEEQICEIAKSVKASGATMLRGGAFKPRTSPYAFQGLRKEGINLLLKAKKETGLPIVTEIMDISHIDLFDEVDVIQVGARNMQNFELLKELGKTNKPILLKRGLSSTISELLMSAEYIMAGGNENVILCERGIRTFETVTRNTLDLSCIPALRLATHLPIIIDPSHATGVAKFVPSMSHAAVAAGADGLIIEVHNDPAHALCDGAQSLTPSDYDKLTKQVSAIHSVVKNFD
ncbi:MAG: 3-deoxy-7-phosphoheptulonate synthase [Clostridia bacterium]|nr:3-deoxy-7-phosphoheptulonate synthase [Clostridia bacterium]